MEKESCNKYYLAEPRYSIKDKSRNYKILSGLTVQGKIAESIISLKNIQQNIELIDIFESYSLSQNLIFKLWAATHFYSLSFFGLYSKS